MITVSFSCALCLIICYSQLFSELNHACHNKNASMYSGGSFPIYLHWPSISKTVDAKFSWLINQQKPILWEKHQVSDQENVDYNLDWVMLLWAQFYQFTTNAAENPTHSLWIIQCLNVFCQMWPIHSWGWKCCVLVSSPADFRAGASIKSMVNWQQRGRERG